MPQGKVKWFNNAKGYGFIIADEGNGDLCKEDLFVHFSSIQMEGYKTLKAGQAVAFEAQPSGKGFHAVNIMPLEALQRSDTTTTEESSSQRSIEESSSEPSSTKPQSIAASA